MEKVERLKLAYEHLRSLGVLHKRKDLAEAMKTSESNISAAFKGSERFLTDSFLCRFNNRFDRLFNESWLLTGEGEMLNESPSEELSIAKAEIKEYSTNTWNEFVKAVRENNGYIIKEPFPLDNNEGIPQEYGEKLATLYLDAKKEIEYWRNKAQDLEYKLAKIGMS